MPREREFNPDDTLRDAIQVFREKGYHATSIDDLVEATGVAKYGLYSAFGSKKDMFLKALKVFPEDRKKDLQEPIRRDNASLPEIHEFFQGVAAKVTQKPGRFGCLMNNTGIEIAPHDTEIRSSVKNMFVELGETFERVLVNAQSKGQLESSMPLDQLGEYLAIQFRTVALLGRSGESKKSIDRYLDIALRVLEE